MVWSDLEERNAQAYGMGKVSFHLVTDDDKDRRW
jgi:hypothetical protein